MKHSILLIGLAFLSVFSPGSGAAADGQIQWHSQGGLFSIRVEGAPDDEWRFQTSGDLSFWSDAPTLGTILSGATNSSAIIIDKSDGAARFYRAIKTDGLYDVALLRTLELTFARTDWQQRLTANYSSGTNLSADLFVNGLKYPGVGVRYKGNTSYSRGGEKKSVNIQIDHSDPALRLMGYETVNLNNAAGDSSMMREALYFNVLRRYAVGPRASFVKLTINGQNWGVYSFAQQQDGDLIDEWFQSSDGDRWKAPSGNGGGGGATGGIGGGGPGGPGGGFASGDRALKFLGTNAATYRALYDLQKQNSTNAWDHLIRAVDILNNTPLAQLRDKVEEVLAVDRWLWFLVLENIFADDDSYWNKGADYKFYYEPETGRIHPIEHDGNEAFLAGDVRLSPVQGEGNANRPVISRLLAVPELRQRYLAHMRTALKESFNPSILNPVIDQYRALIQAEVEKDTKKAFTMSGFQSAIIALKTFVQQRHDFLMTHAELRPLAPIIGAVSTFQVPTADKPAVITAEVRPANDEGIDSVWLYYRAGPVGRFTAAQMFDDGAHDDGAAHDGNYGGTTIPFPAGTKVRYYLEARSGNSVKAAVLAPDRAEEQTFSYRVTMPLASDSRVVINELMAANTKAWADPQGEFDDWIELRNTSAAEVDLAGKYLSDDPTNPRKWAFPAGATIPAHGLLIVWADEDGTAPSGFHANFKLSASGEELFLVDTDQNSNALLDSVAFGAQEQDRSFGRTASNPGEFALMVPTPGQPNR